MKKSLFLCTVCLYAICGIISLTGCNSTNVITEIDPATGKVTKIIKTNESLAKTITESTKNKTVYAWSKGWVAKISAAAATIDNPTPAVEMWAGNVDHGVLSLHKEQNMTHLPETIKACNSSDLNISSNGINASNGTSAQQ